MEKYSKFWWSQNYWSKLITWLKVIFLLSIHFPLTIMTLASSKAYKSLFQCQNWKITLWLAKLPLCIVATDPYDHCCPPSNHQISKCQVTYKTSHCSPVQSCLLLGPLLSPSFWIQIAEWHINHPNGLTWPNNFSYPSSATTQKMRTRIKSGLFIYAASTRANYIIWNPIHLSV